MAKFSDYIERVERSATPEVRAALDMYSLHYDAEVDRLSRIPEALVSARTSRGMTQSRLAELSGIGQSEISRIERGQGNPTLETVTKLLSPLHARLALVDENGHVLS